MLFFHVCFNAFHKYNFVLFMAMNMFVFAPQNILILCKLSKAQREKTLMAHKIGIHVHVYIFNEVDI